jgi:hypothetical protein
MSHDAPPAPPDERAFGWKKSLIYALLPVLVLAAFLEATARVIEIWMPPRVVDIGQGFSSDSRLFIPDPADPAYLITNPSKEVSFQKRRFLKTPPPRTLRAFFLGGSSVNYLDYELPFLAERLQDRLRGRFDRVEIINCGGLSYGSHRLVLIANEITEYAPGLVMLYSAHNEFEEIEQLGLTRLRVLPLQRLLYRSAFCRFLRDRAASYQISELQAARNRRIAAETIPDASRAWNHQFSPEEIAERMDDYRNNLTLMIRLFQDRGIPIILGSVPSNLFKPSLPGEAGQRYQEVLDLFARGEFEKGLALGRNILRNTSPRHQSSDTENEIIRALTRQQGVPLADVEAAVLAAEPHQVPGETLFNDHCHLNPAGNRLLIAAYEKQILRVFGAGS